jgi:hypothetical protein
VKPLKQIIPLIPDDEERKCGCANVLSYSIVTERKLVPDETYEKVKLLVGKYM